MATFTNVNSLLGPDKFYAIPDYQREYAWQNEEIADFWVDLRALFDSPDNSKHFFGAIVTSKYTSDESNLLEVLASTYGIKDNEIFHLIDGQQRLTTLLILLGCIKHCIENDEDLTEGQKETLKDKYENLIFDQSRTAGGECAPKLFTKEKSGSVFCKEVLGIDPINQPDKRFKASKNVLNSIEYFNKQIITLRNDYVEDGNDSNACYRKLFQVITGRAQFCVIDCRDDMDEFQVFESLNGKGINLTAVDRIKNIYLTNARQAFSGSIASRNWDSIKDELILVSNEKEENWIIHFFVSFFFDIDRYRTSKSKLAKRFKDYIKNGEDFPSVHRQLVSAAKFYGKLRKADVTNPELKNTLNELSDLGQEQIYVPLLTFAMRYKIDSDDFRQIAKALLVFIVRYTVCKNPTNALDSIFKAMFELKGSGPKGTPTATEIISFIASKQEDDSEFESKFAAYTTRASGTARYLLSKLEIYYKLKDGDASPTLGGQTLEHIVPQKVNLDEWYDGELPDEAVQASFIEDYVCSIGNMAILKAEDNSRANNKNYDAKRKVYKNGNNKPEYGTPYGTFKLISMLYDTYPDKFTHEQIEQRAKDFAKDAPSIWPMAVVE